MSALVTEKDIFRTPPDLLADCDLTLRLDALESIRKGHRVPGVDGRSARHLLRVRDQLIRTAESHLEQKKASRSQLSLVTHLFTGFPDRVARRRSENSERFLVANGHGARLHDTSAVKKAPIILAVHLTGARRGERSEHMIRLATTVDEAELSTHDVVVSQFDEDKQQIVQYRSRRYASLELGRYPVGELSDPEQAYALLADVVCRNPLKAFNISEGDSVSSWLNRVRWLADVRPKIGVPTFDDFSPSDKPSERIKSLCYGCRSFGELRQLNLLNQLQQSIDFNVRTKIDNLAPPELNLPDGSRRQVRYQLGQPLVYPPDSSVCLDYKQHPRLRGAYHPGIAGPQPQTGSNHPRSNQLLERNISSGAQRAEGSLSETSMARKPP